MMILQPGHWVGRGRLLMDGRSLGDTLELVADVEADDGGFTVRASQAGRAEPRDFAIRAARNDVGTFAVSVRSQGDGLYGTAKLDSPPNLGLLWNDSGTVHATFALFLAAEGYGCRGFVRSGESLYTWEVAFTLQKPRSRVGNVVSLLRPKR